MIPYLSPRESAPILVMTKPPVEKWAPKPGQTIEVAMSLSGMRYQREFLRMEGDIYVTNSQSVLGKEWRWRCAWPIKRMSGPDMTPPPEPYPPGMVICIDPAAPGCDAITICKLSHGRFMILNKSSDV